MSAVISFLTENAARFHLAKTTFSMIEMVTSALAGFPYGELLAAELGSPAIAALAPEDWLESTPLMRALRRELTSRT